MTEYVGNISNSSILPLILQFCNTVTSSEPNEIIHREGEGDVPYMQRWFLARKNMIPEVKKTKFFHRNELGLEPSIVENIYIHKFGAGDVNETLHDHPWWNASLIVSGGYSEQLDSRVVERLAGDVIVRSADDKHAIRNVLPNTVTLFATGVKTRDWGFWVNGEFLHWREFKNNKVTNECKL